MGLTSLQRVHLRRLTLSDAEEFLLWESPTSRPVLVKAYVHQVAIACAEQVIATHPRSYGREGDFLNPAHVLRLILERPGAWDHAKAIHEWQARWPKVYDRYLTALRTHYPEPQGVREFVRVLMLHRTYSEPELAAALEWALTERCYSCEGVLHHLRGTPTLTGSTLEAAGLIVSAPPRVALPDLAQYEQLVLAGSHHGS